ncbi:related to zinc alcohol dehydrogenase [Phialocephala subalpina]|uniref:Related to zinc alcohol dehydrogenase n=1 Tax=Phialocephala subalpina TaxID=576137 RepID=A0A1L7X9Q1_9HELO|nr:related to zinc alcohol dehydrogenase [Phialocephala subalpina]
MKAWQYTTLGGKLEESLVLKAFAPAPNKSSLFKDQILIEVTTAFINPVDYKLLESGLLGKLSIKTLASPGLDFCGRVVAKYASNNALKEGQLVFGALGKASNFGTLGQFTIISSAECALLPLGVEKDEAAGAGTAALTAYQSLLPDVVKPGSNVFINGGSGGVGTFGIQFAKALGAQVTTTCSTANVGLCKGLGADEVLDYKKADVVSELKKKGQVLTLWSIMSEALPYTKTTKPSSSRPELSCKMLQPAFLGGGRRRFHFVRVQSRSEDYVQIGK